MSAIEDTVGRYLDEAVKSTPITSIVAAALGVYLVGFDQPGTSHWAWLLSQKLAIGWDFLTFVRNVSVSTMCVIVACSWLGPWLTKLALRKLLHHARSTVENVIKHTYENAQRIASTEGFKPDDFAIAQNWRKQHSKLLTRSTRLSCFTYSLGLISLAAFATSRASIDVVVAALAFTLGTYTSWKASVQFIRTYLPERILIDSSLGFPTTDLYKNIDDAVNGPTE